jgi:hypothetical protein
MQLAKTYKKLVVTGTAATVKIRYKTCFGFACFPASSVAELPILP